MALAVPRCERGASMRRGAANHFAIKARLVGDRVLAHVDALGADDEPMIGLAASLEITHASAEVGAVSVAPTRVPMAEPTPGAYEAEAPVRGPGALLLAARFNDGPSSAPLYGLP